MTGHLGRRVSDLLDGQLDAAETEAAWAHVHSCHSCRDDVEREGWVKTSLSALSFHDDADGCAPDRLKGMLLGMPPGDCFVGNGSVADFGPHASHTAHGGQHDLTNRRPRRGVGGFVGFAAIGGGAAGAAVMGVLALGTAPADAPTPSPERRAPVAQVTPRTAPGPVPVRLGP